MDRIQQDRPERIPIAVQPWLRLSFFTVIVITIAILVINISLASEFINSLIFPACQHPQSLPAYNQPEEYWLETQDGVSIRIWYYPSKNGAAILTFGGLTGSLGDKIPPVQFLLQEGYGILQVDTRACAIPPAPVTLGADELYEAESALYFLLDRPEVDPNRIGVMGFSMGGATAIRLAARHTEVNALVRDGGYSNLETLLTPPGKVSPLQKLFQSTVYLYFNWRTGVDPWSISPIEDLPEISPRPVFLIYGEGELGPGLEQFESPGESKELWIVPGGAHGQNHVAQPGEYQFRVLNFFEKALLK